MTDEPQTHPMTLARTYPTGATHFVCPICHRELITDGLHRIALVEGDVTAMHSGSTGGLQMGEVEVEAIDPRLDVFSEWLKGQEDEK